MLHLHKWSIMHNDDVCCLWTHAWPMLCNVDVCCAMLCWRLLHLHTWSMLRYVEVRSTCRHGQRCISLTSCICTHGRRYAMLTSLAHLVDAAQCWRLLHLQTWWLLRAVNVLFLHSCTHRSCRCYAMLASCALAHMFDAILCSRLKTWIVGPIPGKRSRVTPAKSKFRSGSHVLATNKQDWNWNSRFPKRAHKYPVSASKTKESKKQNLRTRKGAASAGYRVVVVVVVVAVVAVVVVVVVVVLVVVVVVVVVGGGGGVAGVVGTTLLYSLQSLEKFVYRKFQLSFLSLRIKWNAGILWLWETCLEKTKALESQVVPNWWKLFFAAVTELTLPGWLVETPILDHDNLY